MTVLTPVEFRPFEPGDETAFRELNQAWIASHFVVEEKDWEVLNDPVGHILQPGGALLMAVQDGVPIGTCALLAMGDGSLGDPADAIPVELPVSAIAWEE